MYFLLNMVIFQCHVSFQEVISHEIQPFGRGMFPPSLGTFSDHHDYENHGPPKWDDPLVDFQIFGEEETCFNKAGGIAGIVCVFLLGLNCSLNHWFDGSGQVGFMIQHQKAKKDFKLSETNPFGRWNTERNQELTPS